MWPTDDAGKGYERNWPHKYKLKVQRINQNCSYTQCALFIYTDFSSYIDRRVWKGKRWWGIPGYWKWGLLVASRRHFSHNGCVSVGSEGHGVSCIPRSVHRVYSCAEDIGSRVPWFDVRLRRYTLGQIKRELDKIQIHRLPHYVTVHYITLCYCTLHNIVTVHYITLCYCTLHNIMLLYIT